MSNVKFLGSEAGNTQFLKSWKEEYDLVTNRLIALHQSPDIIKEWVDELEEEIKDLNDKVNMLGCRCCSR